MQNKIPFTALSLLSLALPILGHSGNIWMFSGLSQTAPAAEATVAGATPDVAMSTMQQHNQTCQHKPKKCHKKNWDATLSLGAGYRHDRLSQRLTPRDNSPFQRLKFKYRDIDSVMGVLRFDARYSNLLFNVEGDYSPVVSGTLSAPYNSDPAINNVFDFRFKKLTGYEADAMASIGYRLLFINGSWSKAALIFQAGYRYSHQSYETESQDRTTVGTNISILQDQAPCHTEWFGPFIEGRISFCYHNRYYIQPFYQYHFLDYRSQREEAQKLYSFTGGTPPVTSDIIMRFWTHGDEARGQLGGADIFYQAPGKHLRLGIKGAYLDFQSRETRTKVRQRQTMFTSNPPTSTTTHPKYDDAHTNWKSFSIYGYAGYSF